MHTHLSERYQSKPHGWVLARVGVYFVNHETAGHPSETTDDAGAGTKPQPGFRNTQTCMHASGCRIISRTYEVQERGQELAYRARVGRSSVRTCASPIRVL